MTDAPHTETVPFGPGAVVAMVDGAGPGVTGMATWPTTEQTITQAANCLRALNGAVTPTGGVFVLGRFAEELEALAAHNEIELNGLRSQLRAAHAADPRRRLKAWAGQRAFDMFTRANRVAEGITERYRERYGDDRWDDY